MQSVKTTEIWAQLFLRRSDQRRIEDFLQIEFSIHHSSIVHRMHITVYHARRPMPGVCDLSEPASLTVPASETRFMVMAPGGENTRLYLEPGRRKVGIRVHRQSSALPHIRAYRERLLRFESDQVLGGRLPSDHRRNAFGAQHFQPHMVILLAGSGVNRDLTVIGERFRACIGDLVFDRFLIETVVREKEIHENDNS